MCWGYKSRFFEDEFAQEEQPEPVLVADEVKEPEAEPAPPVDDPERELVRV